VPSAEDAGELHGELGRDIGRGHHPGGGAFRDCAREQPFGRWNGQQCRHRVRAGALAEDRDSVRVTAEGCDVVAHPLQREHQVAQKQVVIDRVIGR
jgi:hypothetical protein